MGLAGGGSCQGRRGDMRACRMNGSGWTDTSKGVTEEFLNFSCDFRGDVSFEGGEAYVEGIVDNGREFRLHRLPRRGCANGLSVWAGVGLNVSHI